MRFAYRKVVSAVADPILERPVAQPVPLSTFFDL